MQDVIRASLLLPHYVVSQLPAKKLIRAIARDARQLLGRRASRSPYWLDGGAIEAVERAAQAHGIPTQIAGWAWCGATLSQLSRSLVFRAVESGLLLTIPGKEEA